MSTSPTPRSERAPDPIARVDPRIERTRQVVLRAALDELGDVGFGAFTIESVAKRAGVGKSTIYRHWQSKQELVGDAFETFHSQMVPHQLDGPIVEQLATLLGHVAEIVVDSTFSTCIPALVEGAERDDRLRTFHHEFSATRRAELTRIIVQAQADGTLDLSIDSELATIALLAPIFYRRLFMPDPFDPGQIPSLVELVLRPQSSENEPEQIEMQPIGRVTSTLTDLEDAPRQSDEGAPDAWIELDYRITGAAKDLSTGQEIVVLTWLDHASRDVLSVHPRDDRRRRPLGVFSTRSPARPNPIGLHHVTVLMNEGHRLLVSGLEAIDGTPVLDVKPVLEPLGHR